jgi:hypothetical protein
MATRKLSLAIIRRTVSALPGVEEGTSYGTPAWRHKGKLLARLHQDGRSIVLKVGNETRDHLLQADPETFFVTDHYIGYPMVLARLDRLVYGSADPKAGFVGSHGDLVRDPRLNHRADVTGGVLAEESGELLRAFFRARR